MTTTKRDDDNDANASGDAELKARVAELERENRDLNESLRTAGERRPARDGRPAPAPAAAGDSRTDKDRQDGFVARW